MDDSLKSILQAVSSMSCVLEELERDTTCVICLDPMVDACQMSCGHFFCGSCIERILRQPNTEKQKMRCALCKHPATKRSIRSAPIPVAGIIASCQRLRAVIERAQSSYKQDFATFVDENHVKTMNDGFPPSLQIPPGSNCSERPAAGIASPCPSSSVAGNTKESQVSTDCVFCPADYEELRKAITPINFGPTYSVASAPRSSRACKVHEECALYSDDVYYRNQKLINVEKAVKNSRSTHCSRRLCRKTGASVRCSFGKCSKSFHYVCAVVESCAVVNDGSYKVFCPTHKSKAPVIENDVFEILKVAADSSQAKQSPDDCFECGVGGRLLLCDGCDSSWHLGCSGLKSLPLGEWFCRLCRNARPSSAATRWDDKENVSPPMENSAAKSNRKRNSRPVPDVKPAKKRCGTTKKKDQSRTTSRVTSSFLSDQSSRVTNEGKFCHEPSGPELKKVGSRSQKRSAISGDRQCASLAVEEKYTNAALMQSGQPQNRSKYAEQPFVCLPTGLSADDKRILRAAQKRHKGILHVASGFSARVTHILVNVREPDVPPTRTIKLCKGIASSLPVVCFSWIEIASRASVLPNVSRHVHHYSSPAKRYPFSGMRFYFGVIKDHSVSKEDLSEIVQLGKGSIMLNEPTSNMSSTPGKVLYVRSDLDESCSLRPSRRRSSVVDLERQLPPDCKIVSPTWILDSCLPVIGQQ